MSEDKRSSPHITAAYIGGAFLIVAACVSGLFLLANTLLDKGFVIVGPALAYKSETLQESHHLRNQARQDLAIPKIFLLKRI